MRVSMKAARVNANLTIDEAAKALKIAPSTLVRWEQGKTPPTVTQFCEMCQLYGCSMNDIFLPEMQT